MLPHRALVPVLLFSVWQFARRQDVVNQKLSHVRGKLLFISQQCKEDGANIELSRGTLRMRNAAQFSRELIFCSDFPPSQEEGGCTTTGSSFHQTTEDEKTSLGAKSRSISHFMFSDKRERVSTTRKDSVSVEGKA